MRHSSVQHRFWDEAVCTVVYLSNRLPMPTLRNRSPYHLVFNQEPTYSVLRNFGCTCYPCLRPYATSELDSRSDKFIFLGYNASHLGYRCLSLSSGKLYISRDVIFREHDYPFASSSPVNNSPSSSPLRLLGSSPASTSPTYPDQSPLTSSDSTIQPSESPIFPTSSASLALSASLVISAPPIFPALSASPISPDSPISPVLPTTPTDSSHPNSSLNAFRNLTNSPENSLPSHIPSTNPLSPSNLDFNTSRSHTKTR